MAAEKKNEFEIIEINETMLQSKIYFVRNQKVMLDFELAEIYGYTTKRFNEQIKNNIERFDEDFRFKLTGEEVNNLRSKNSTSSWGGSRYLPYAFTEQGIFHDRYIILDYGTDDEKVFLCGASSKDAGGRITSILEDPDRMKYDSMIKDLFKNNQLVLK